MKRALSYTAGILGIAIGLTASIAFAQTTANGPYYATPSWDQTLPSNTRFIVLSNMNSEAVLDRETGLVWEKVPSNSEITLQGQPGQSASTYAHGRCRSLGLGNRAGWRVPSFHELQSLFDPSQSNLNDIPALPAGHPFTNVSGSRAYWTSTPFEGSAFFNILRPWFPTVSSVAGPEALFLVWCVRGPS